MIRLALADDDPIVLKCLERALEQEPDLRVVLTAADGQMLLSELRTNEVDVALVDIDMPLLDGVAATKRIRCSFPDVTVIILTAFEKEDMLDLALAAGAAGFLTKDVPLEDLPSLVRRARSGETVIGSRPASILVDAYRKQAMRRQEYPAFVEAVESLPPGVRLVLSRIVSGLPNKLIAKELGRTESTVRTYVTRILDATNCESRTQLVVRALAAGIE